MNGLLDSAQRLRQGLNPLMTSGSQVQVPYQTPPSSSSAALSTPFGYQPAPYTPASAVRQYNPQQWGGSSNPAPENGVRYSPPDPEEGVTFAPPPYSPPRSQRPAGFSPEEAGPSMSSLNRISPAVTHRPSPEPTANQIFPPPPGSRTRALSRDRPQALFNLGGVFNRKPATPTPDGGDAPSSSTDTRELASSSRRPAPIIIDSTQSEEPVDPRPPASRRAASTGAIGTPSSSRSRGSSLARWEPGMPLPPPPPGPPPQASSRSQSLNRTPEPVISPPTRRPQTISSLGPVPPTPAGWNEGDALPRSSPRGRSPLPGLQIDTSSTSSSNAGESNSGSASGSAGLSRAKAVRGESKSIRERRSESRTGKQVSVEEQSKNPWQEAITPSDIVVPPMTVLGRRPTINKSTPKSARSLGTVETPNSSRTAPADTPPLIAPTPESRGSTPRPLNSSRLEAPTPPFSPDQSYTHPNNSSSIPPKSLPTPPPQRPRKASSPRPISHLLHTPLKDAGMIAPLSPLRSSPSSRNTTESFGDEAVERHNAFAQREAAAATDEERVRLFAEFIVTESRLRRERYAAAIDAMGSELLELTRDLFRPYTSSQRSSANSHTPERSSRTVEFRMSQGTRLTPLQTGSRSDSAPNSASSMSSQTGRPESMWTGYMPSLSPIASISASAAQDDNSSRGRPSSRWWEVGQSQSGGGSPTVKLERSKRESKYMGVPREQMESLQWEDSAPSSSSQDASSAFRAGPSTQMYYGPDEYPPEKVGFHDDLSSPPVARTPTRNGFALNSPAPITPNPRHLDVSRLVTLPPPYPRHHPAVNNNHPDLSEIRTSVRSLSDLKEVESTKERFNLSSQQSKDAASAASSQRRQALRVSIQRQIDAGTMTYADAAKLEADSTAAEAETSKGASKTDFDLFQTSVVGPLNDLLMDRVHQTTALFEQLRSKLFVDAQQQDPNATQEEGDEQPELLEKLTLLKWIFEAREQLHREVYDLLSDRNNRYKTMVTAPYRLSGNIEKLRNAERFFADDSHKRQLEFDERALQRTIDFMDVIETNVVRGVEVQLSAFWDIAPPLRQITEKIPKTLTSEFQVQIPQDEYEENPGYYDFPMQYLYSLLEHGQKSAYQFIESQINLLCLLHEVKESVVTARCKVVETERLGAAGGSSASEEEAEAVREDVKRARESEENKLTEDLKEKVRCVEELWGSALGIEFEGVKERVREFLMNEGGWEEVEE